MKIQLSDIGKRYGKHWLFRHISEEFGNGDRIGIKGINGSGKSTLLQLIAGICLPTEGKLTYVDDKEKELDLNGLATHISIVSPYMDVPEQLTVREIYQFQSNFSPFKQEIDLKKFLEVTLLEEQENSFIKQFSSGMKQRLKLGLCFLSESQVLFLDEPCSNLDTTGKELYKQLLEKYSTNRLIFIASNEENTELIDCDRTFDLNALKNG